MEKLANYFGKAVLMACTVVLAGSPILDAQVPQPVPGYPQPVDTGVPVPVPGNTGQPATAFPPGELDNLVAPIALYPDPLLSQVLVASTYPLEIVQAYQWLQSNQGLGGQALTDAAARQNWDPSVQALVMFPNVLSQLNQDITWTTNLGNAYLDQPQDVMASVQRLRVQAQQQGRLASTPQQTVTVASQAGQPQVIIEPANPEVIYVPTYDPAWFWGPALYYPYPRWYYPRASGLFFSFGPGINIGAFFGPAWGGWRSWGWRPLWANRTIIVNRGFIESHHFNNGGVRAFGGTNVWAHDSFHRHGVPYPGVALNQRYRANVQQNLRAGPPIQARAVPRPGPGNGMFARSAPAPAMRAPAAIPAFRAPAERMGNRQVAPNLPSRNRSAFGGIENGGVARAHINQGYSSLGPARSVAPHSSSPGGGGGGRSGGGGHGGGHHR